ncbi:DNA polymerase III subunit delta [Ancylomarina euxinus]|uniref:DNA polymerase III subunit delta n=1 Tax=Ancylomarina euxinus TaxID=2283627 RepID=A0A425Y678_9BACT|nr:DNA polymerase III subunit delta [Ancylomarina euxinus]MCZ4694126.1 DNA polymerase III subunit delta [Ancylomarina euxinus]MUP15792.1 DNA polymerase III subunit delta [Ancylomarina euxinus]RRG24004.1 DNA polymerase III subunit delta [Ancylomarina euxinus]
MTFEEIYSSIKKQEYAPIYFLMGEESFYIDKITDYILDNALAEAERDFNQTIFYGKDADMANIMDTARRFPMMSTRQLVVVKEAQQLKNIELLDSYVKNPLKSTILVINYKYKSLDKRKAFTKNVAQHGILFESKKIYENQLPDWISKYTSSLKLKIDTKASILLSEFLGNDLSKISNELDKLSINIPQGNSITADDIEKNIGISKDFNNFELQNALGKKDVVKANQIINYFSTNEKNNPIYVTIALLHSYFSKILKFHFLKNKTNDKIIASALGINPFFVKDYKSAARLYNPKKLVSIINHLREYDLKSKGFGNVSSKNGDLLKELIFKTLH